MRSIALVLAACFLLTPLEAATRPSQRANTLVVKAKRMRLSADDLICDLGPEIEKAVSSYASDVRARAFPGPEHVYGMKDKG